MSDDPNACWTVQPEDGTMSPKRWASLLELREKYGIPPVPDERTPSGDGGILLKTPYFRPCVWDNQTTAQAFADEIGKLTSAIWKVVPTPCDES